MTWPEVPLGEVVTFLDHLRRPITGMDRQPGSIPYYGANGQQDSVAGQLFDEPLVLLAEDGGHFSAPERGVAYKIEGPSWVNNHAHVLRAKPPIDNSFLFRVLQNRDLSAFVTGTTRAKLTKGSAERISIPLPPLPEQRRIASILDQADNLRAQRRGAQSLGMETSASLFLQMFGDPVTNPMSWPQKELGAMGEIVTGNTPSRTRPEYFGGDLEWIKSDNISMADRNLTKASEFLSEEGREVARTVASGSILVTCIAGSPNSIGNAALSDREVSFNQQINAFTPSSLTPRFALSHFRLGKKLVQNASSGGMKGLVSKSRFSSIQFMVPPWSLQQEFGERTAVTDQIDFLQGYHLKMLDELFASLQYRAFRGEL